MPNWQGHSAPPRYAWLSRPVSVQLRSFVQTVSLSPRPHPPEEKLTKYPSIFSRTQAQESLGKHRSTSQAASSEPQVPQVVVLSRSSDPRAESSKRLVVDVRPEASGIKWIPYSYNLLNDVCIVALFSQYTICTYVAAVCCTFIHHKRVLRFSEEKRTKKGKSSKT